MNLCFVQVLFWRRFLLHEIPPGVLSHGPALRIFAKSAERLPTARGWGPGKFWETTLPETSSSPVKIGRNPKGKESSLPTIHFPGWAVSFREGNCGGFFLGDFPWRKRDMLGCLWCLKLTCFFFQIKSFPTMNGYFWSRWFETKK